LVSGFAACAAAALAAASLMAAGAEPDAPRADAAPNDPLFGLQWPLANREQAAGAGDVGALEAWT
jgi:hypothetical protein